MRILSIKINILSVRHNISQNPARRRSEMHRSLIFCQNNFSGDQWSQLCAFWAHASTMKILDFSKVITFNTRAKTARGHRVRKSHARRSRARNNTHANPARGKRVSGSRARSNRARKSRTQESARGRFRAREIPRAECPARGHLRARMELRTNNTLRGKSTRIQQRAQTPRGGNRM